MGTVGVFLLLLWLFFTVGRRWGFWQKMGIAVLIGTLFGALGSGQQHRPDDNHWPQPGA